MEDAQHIEQPITSGANRLRGGSLHSGGTSTGTSNERRRYRPNRAVVTASSEADWDMADQDARDSLRFFGRLAFALTLLLVLIFALMNARSDFNTVLSTFSVRFLSVFIEAAPFLLLGTLFSGLIEVFVRQEHITRWVPRNRVLGVLAGIFAGVAFPVCECGVVPVVRQLYAKNLPMSVGIAFLLAAPVMNPIVFFSTLTAFGWGSVVIGRFAITIGVVLIIALAFSFARQAQLLRPQVANAIPSLPATVNTASIIPLYPAEENRPPVATRLKRALIVAGDEFFEMGRFLIIGSLLAAGMQTLVSQDTLLSLGQGPFVSVLMMQSLAFLLSVCSTVDAFIALAFMGTFTTGSILAFLTFGPMVDVKSTILFLGVFKRKIVVLLIFLPFLMTLLIGSILNLLGIS